MRISDGSADVCSSDLGREGREQVVLARVERVAVIHQFDVHRVLAEQLDEPVEGSGRRIRAALGRSDELRVGKACVSTCSSRWSPYHLHTHITLGQPTMNHYQPSTTTQKYPIIP